MLQNMQTAEVDTQQDFFRNQDIERIVAAHTTQVQAVSGEEKEYSERYTEVSKTISNADKTITQEKAEAHTKKS